MFVLVKVTIDTCTPSVHVHTHTRKSFSLSLSISISLSNIHTHYRAGPTAAVMNAARMQNALLGQQATPAINPGSGAAALMSKFLSLLLKLMLNIFLSPPPPLPR